MRIGYACLLVGVADTGFKSCTKKKATEDHLMTVIDHNLTVLDKIIDYNIRHHIGLFRITSDLIPFGSSPVNSLKWWDLFSKRWETIGKKIKEHHIRISMHPGQYTVLNSPKKEVVQRAVADLEYHAQVLECLDSSPKNKIILHIGGAYGDKEGAMNRFIENYHQLSERVKKHLIIENDDKIYNIGEVMEISQATGAPIVFDVFHHQIHPDKDHQTVGHWLKECKRTWQPHDGVPKIHYSEQNPQKQPGSHSETIGVEKFPRFVQDLEAWGENVDIMLEVKDKNLSAVKCLNLINPKGKIKYLEEEWARYKYLVLEHSQKDYRRVRELLKEKSACPVKDFYQILQHAMECSPAKGSVINGLDHVWGHLKEQAAEKEKRRYHVLLEGYQEGRYNLESVKKHLWKLVVKYQEPYLIQSLYFKDIM